MSLHRINVRLENGLHRLYNHDFIAGDRLNKGGQWPFSSPDWMKHKTKAKADEAAAKLQKYLDAREPQLGRK